MIASLSVFNTALVPSGGSINMIYLPVPIVIGILLLFTCLRFLQFAFVKSKILVPLFFLVIIMFFSEQLVALFLILSGLVQDQSHRINAFIDTWKQF